MIRQGPGLEIANGYQVEEPLVAPLSCAVIANENNQVFICEIIEDSPSMTTAISSAKSTLKAGLFFGVHVVLGTISPEVSGDCTFQDKKVS